MVRLQSENYHERVAILHTQRVPLQSENYRESAIFTHAEGEREELVFSVILC